MLTVTQAAEKLGLHRDTLLRQIQRGSLHAKRLGSIWVVSAAEGSVTSTFWKRRASAWSLEKVCRYSSQVVAPMQRRVPSWRAGLSRFEASIVPRPALPWGRCPARHPDPDGVEERPVFHGQPGRFQQFGQSVIGDMKKRMIEELRKNGAHTRVLFLDASDDVLVL